MFNKIKELVKKNLDAIKYASINKQIIESKVNMLGKCFKYNMKNYTLYTKLVSVNTEDNTFTALVIYVPDNINSNNEEDVLVTNKFGPYIMGDSLPYKDLSISFIDGLETDKINDNLENEIDINEFSETLTSVMDKLLKIGY